MAVMADGSPLYVRLDEAAFRRLVAGDRVVLYAIGGEEVWVILADIGWGRMLAAVTDARNRARDEGAI